MKSPRRPQNWQSTRSRAGQKMDRAAEKAIEGGLFKARETG